MSLWAFRFLLWYICILFTQPQNRFLFLHPLHIADICVIASLGLHFFSAMQEGKLLIRFGLATKLALALFIFSLLSLYIGPLQSSSSWNSYSDYIAKNALVLILIEVMAYNAKRVWAVQATMLLSSLWWVKAGLRLSAANATYAGDRIMGAAVGLVENPNGFAYMMCVMIPLYLLYYQQSSRKTWKLLFLFLSVASVYIVFQTGSRTGFLILIILAAFLFPRYGGHHKFAVIIIGIAIFFVFTMVGALNVERFKSIPESIDSFLTGEVKSSDELTQDQQSAQERRLKNRDTWHLIKQYPLFGVGINANQYRYAGRFPYAVGQVHCEILMAGRMMGIVGMGIYGTMILALLFLGAHIQKSTKQSWGAISDLGWTFKLQAIVFAVGGAFSPLPWNAPMMILVGSVSALWMNLGSKRD